ncbi:MAG: cytochrome c [Ginsengibacter sp.]
MKKVIIIAVFFSFIMLLLMGMKNNSLNENRRLQPDIKKSIIAGEKVFKKYCISCHQADGSGVPNLNPPLINTTYVMGDKEKLIKIILNGLNEEVEIDDEVFANPMPALGSVLKDQQIADVLTFVRNSFGNKASAITANEVKAVRSEKK